MDNIELLDIFFKTIQAANKLKLLEKKDKTKKDKILINLAKCSIAFSEKCKEIAYQNMALLEFISKKDMLKELELHLNEMSQGCEHEHQDQRVNH